jgi:tetratricopeptide (TPR) repeat protein
MAKNSDYEVNHKFVIIASLSPFLFDLNLTQRSTNLRTLLENGIFIMIYLMIIVFLLMAVRWMFIKEDIVILPFDVGTDIKTFNGKAVSDLLLHELRETQRIHETHRYLPIVSEKTAEINMSTANESLSYKVSSFGTITFGSISLSLGQLLIFIKRLFPFVDAGRVISGSLQEYGSSYAIVACMEYRPKEKETKEIRTWFVDSKDDKQILVLIKDLAFKIVKDLYPEANAKTWKGLKHFTDALDAFDQYASGSNMNELEKSKEHCFNALNEEPDYSNPFSLLYCIAQAYFSKKHYEDAETLLKQLLKYKKYKSDIAAFYLLGNVFENGLAKKYIDNSGLAQIYYDDAIELIPRDAIDWSYKGFIFLHQENFDEAIKAFDEAIRQNPKNAIAWNYKGYALDKKGDFLKERFKDEEANKAYGEAIKAFNEAWNQDTNYPMPLNNKGYALNRLNKCEEAIEILDKVIKLDPNFAVPWNNKGYALNRQRKYNEAIKAYDEAIRLDPTFASAWHNKGEVLSNKENYDEAIKAYDEAIRLDPTFALAWNNKGVVLSNKGNYNEAIKVYDEAIRLDPTFALAWNNKGIAQKMLGLTSESDASLAKAKNLGYIG